MKAVLEYTGVRKRFPQKEALSGVDLCVEEGGSLGIIGRNGAGKTTMIKLALGFLRPSEGAVRVFGEVPGAFPGRTGYLSETSEYHLVFTGREYLGHMAGISGIDIHEKNRLIPELLELTGMADGADRPMARYSKGMLQRIGIAQAMITSPDLLILDEPFSGLDPSGQRELCDIISNLRTMKKTIVVCSHILAHLEKVCGAVAVIHSGRVLRQGRIEDLLSKKGHFTIGIGNAKKDLIGSLAARYALAEREDGRFVFGEREPGEKERLLKELIDGGASIDELAPSRESLDDFFELAIAADGREGGDGS